MTNKSQEGSQFCRGFGGIGGILRYQVDLREFDGADEVRLRSLTRCQVLTLAPPSLRMGVTSTNRTTTRALCDPYRSPYSYFTSSSSRLQELRQQPRHSKYASNDCTNPRQEMQKRAALFLDSQHDRGEVVAKEDCGNGQFVHADGRIILRHAVLVRLQLFATSFPVLCWYELQAGLSS